MYIKTISSKNSKPGSKTLRYGLLLLILLIALTTLSCAKNQVKNYVEENLEGLPEYLEETYLSTQTTSETIEELKRLNSIEPPTYRLGHGDKMKIYVYDEPELDTDVVIVKQDGTLSFRLVGEVYVQGMTLAEVTALLESKLKAYIQHPKVSIIPFEARSATITILGKVTYPQVYEIKGKMRVLDAIAAAGGLALGYFQANSVEMADLERSVLIRNGEILPIDFIELVQKGNMLFNIPLMDKDYMYFPSNITREIYCLGEVNEQGHFVYQEKMSLMQTIAYAQGLKNTASKYMYVIRGNLSHPRIFKIDTKAVMQAKIRDFPLKPYDIVFVPKTPIAKWNDVIYQALPSLQAIQSAWFINDMANTIRGNN
jgi:polysaccharide export outer membrane protein